MRPCAWLRGWILHPSIRFGTLWGVVWSWRPCGVTGRARSDPDVCSDCFLVVVVWIFSDRIGFCGPNAAQLGFGHGDRTPSHRHFGRFLGLCCHLCGPVGGNDCCANVIRSITGRCHTWLVADVLPIMMVALLVQAGSEEIVFRGYLHQQMAA